MESIISVINRTTFYRIHHTIKSRVLQHVWTLWCLFQLIYIDLLSVLFKNATTFQIHENPLKINAKLLHRK